MPIVKLRLGPVPTDEPRAELGRTPAYDRYALLEANVHRAAVIARFGPPPPGALLRGEGENSGRGRRYDLVARFDDSDRIACGWAAAVAWRLARWSDADFLAPVLYDEVGAARELVYSDHFDAARRVIVALERLLVDGQRTKRRTAALTHLRAAYPREAAEADQLLCQLSTERSIRPADARCVTLFAPYKLTFFPAMFNDLRGSDRLRGDVIDIEARERRGERLYLMVDLGSVRTVDQALDACWEHLARYVVR